MGTYDISLTSRRIIKMYILLELTSSLFFHNKINQNIKIEKIPQKINLEKKLFLFDNMVLILKNDLRSMTTAALSDDEHFVSPILGHFFERCWLSMRPV